MLFSRSAGESKRLFTIFGKLPSRTDFLAVQASHPVVKDLDRLLDLVETEPPGSTVTLEVFRQGQRLQLTLRVETTSS